MKLDALKSRLFSLNNARDFDALALAVFCYQYAHVDVYRRFCKALNRSPKNVIRLEDIPYLPIQFFKTHKVLSTEKPDVEAVFTSSGTTGKQTSRHYIPDLKIYENTFFKGFEAFYGPLEDYVVLALLPSYLERQGSSLIYMANAFINKSTHPESGFYLNNYAELAETLRQCEAAGKKTLLIGVSFALLDMADQYTFHLKNTIIMETGGMKGRRKEMTRTELHKRLSRGFGVEQIHSEYGMTELLSQAYSQGNGLFKCPWTMQVIIREIEDPFHFLPAGKTGGLNIIDLANLQSCAFIATQDLGKHQPGHTEFEVLGRFDNSDIRGCNLMVI